MDKIKQILGTVLILTGVLGLIVIGILSAVSVDSVTNGMLPTVSFVLIVLGLVFFFPTLLEESQGNVSTMRVIVLMVVLVFCIVYIKLGWIAGSFEQLSIDKSWIYILGLAFGSKAFQKFAEDKNTDDTTDKPKDGKPE
jgi:hypothetical protein